MAISLYMKVIFFCLFMFFSNTMVAAEDSEKSLKNIDSTGWEFGVFIGYLEVPIPLRDVKELPPILPFIDAAYYGENFFFDKWTLGYQLTGNNAYSVSAIASVLEDSLYFIDEQDNIGSRKVAASGGLELYFSNSWGDIAWQGLYDITQVHNGYLMELSYAFPVLDQGFWRLGSRLGVSHKSGKLLNYYYGIRSDEISKSRSAYSASAGNNLFWELEANYQVSEYWQLKAVILYNKLTNEISDSPLVDKTSLFSYFIGIGYEW